MNFSYDSTELIADAQETMQFCGSRFEVYAIYSLQSVDGQEYEYISGFVDAKEPTRDEADSEDEYKQLISEWQGGLDSLKDTKNELMTIDRLIHLLNEQNSTI